MNPVLIHYTVAPGARTPTHVVPGGTILDLYPHLPDGPIEVEPCGQVRVRTGVRLALPPGCVAQLRTRSEWSGAFHSFEVMDLPGIIDENFREEIVVTLQNGQPSAPQSLHPDMRIAQLVVCPVGPVCLVPTATLPVKSSETVLKTEAVIKNDLLPVPCSAPEGFTWQAHIFELVGPNGLCALVSRIGDSWFLYKSEMNMIKFKVSSRELAESISELSNSSK